MIPANRFVPEALRANKRVRDSVFDLVFPTHVRRVSATFWTPVDVAASAARWFEACGCSSVLDVGAGAGKFCIVASLTSGRLITGVEQRGELVEVGRAAAAEYGAQVQYVHGTLESIDAGQFDAFYFFNPFGENLYAPSEQFDSEVELSALRRMHDLSIVEHWLDRAPADTCLMTYHGFGGRIPSSYDLVRTRAKGSDHLQLWKKRAAR
jgi:predicted RNA methylase